MREAQKQEILDFINSLHQAHMEVKETLYRRDYDLAKKMLGECQEFAISLGENIERMEGKSHITVFWVEEYCKILFFCYEEISGGQNNENKIYKSLKKQLLKIENSVKNDIHTVKEIVFFPYKASMWDSLESVYLAAKEDPDCRVYCVPIPYYDLNVDHSFGRMHYEGRQYPDDVEVIDWQSYSFEKRKPDVIYIHNPYDNCNHVTSVHPRYYSSNLRKYTDMLVYIPYFILGEIEPDDQTSIDHIKHFIWTPGVIHSNKVIVQSEKMKQIYINEYLKSASTSGLDGEHIDRNYLEQKILGLGSPKVDKVLRIKKEDYLEMLK
jgi:hypothetical protein